MIFKSPACPSCSQSDLVIDVPQYASAIDSINLVDPMDDIASPEKVLVRVWLINQVRPKLNPPLKPIDPGLASANFGLFCVGSFVLFWVHNIIYNSTKASASIDNGAAFSSWLFWILPGFGISLFLTGFINFFLNLKKKNAYRKITLPRYQEAMAIYNDAYVCERCRHVFLSLNNKVLTFSEFKDYISSLSV